MNLELLHRDIFVITMMLDMVLSDFSPSGMPCIYEGYLSTARNWFGYLANITVVVTGRMLFEFTYPAKQCCHNVLFYSAKQVAFISPHMTCWQKEYVLRPENDQILRLTPRFSWSGCHLVHPVGELLYICEGGRSFAVDDEPRHASTWHLAISNCATRSGIDLRYRLVVYGVIGQCQHHFREAGEKLSVRIKAHAQFPQATSEWYDTVSKSTCIVEGSANSLDSWFGFLANVSLHHGGGFRFHFRFPALMSVPVTSQILSVLLYTTDDVRRLNAEQTCWQRYTLISHKYHPEQLIEIASKSSWNGCASENLTDEGLIVTCHSERRFDGARQFHIAVSNCRHPEHGIQLQYRLEFYDYDSVTQYCISCRAYFHIMLTVVCNFVIFIGVSPSQTL